MARNPSPLETAPPRQGPALPLPPESCRLPRRPRTTSLPTAGFATIEKKQPFCPPFSLNKIYPRVIVAVRQRCCTRHFWRFLPRLRSPLVGGLLFGTCHKKLHCLEECKPKSIKNTADAAHPVPREQTSPFNRDAFV